MKACSTAQRALSKIQPEVVENLKEDALSGLMISAWVVFEQFIKDVVIPDYASHLGMLQADFHRNVFGLIPAEQDEAALIYQLRNSLVHYTRAYHASKTVDIT